MKWNRLLPAIPGLHGYCYQSEMERSAHAHTHSDEDERKMGEKGMEGEMRGRQRRDFSATSMINISLFFILLEQLRNNFLLALTQTGIKSFSPLLSLHFHSPTEVTVVKPLPLVTVIVSSLTACLCKGVSTVNPSLWCVLYIWSASESFYRFWRETLGFISFEKDETVVLIPLWLLLDDLSLSVLKSFGTNPSQVKVKYFRSLVLQILPQAWSQVFLVKVQVPRQV